MSVRGALLGLLACVSLAACAAGVAAPVDDGAQPAWLTGAWKGIAWQTGAAVSQGDQSLRLTFASDGTWKSDAGERGTSRLDGDRVVLEGTTRDGFPVRYTLERRRLGGDYELWGVQQAGFSTAAVSLTRAR